MTTQQLQEITTCQLCSSERTVERFKEDPYTVLECADCGLVYVTPRFSGEALREVYGHTYWRSDKPRVQGYSDYTADEELYLKTYRHRLGFLEHLLDRKLRVLDVGCAAGFFLRIMSEKGHEVAGIELSAEIATHAKEHLGVDAVHVGTLDDVPADHPKIIEGSFDLVTMWDVVEHVPDPQSLLRRARKLLKPTGKLVLETQNVSSSFAKLLGRRWHHYKHAEHLYHFNRETIRTLLGQAGFEIERNTASYGGKYVSLGFIAERAARLHAVVSLMLKPLTLLKHSNLYLNFRDEMVVMARPTDGPPPPGPNGQVHAGAFEASTDIG